jgi:hypothetical protein
MCTHPKEDFMKDLKTLLDQGFDDAENVKEIREMYKENLEEGYKSDCIYADRVYR